MKIKCPRCKSQLEVDAIGDLVSCPYCLLEFNVEEPKPRKSIWFILTNFRWSKINWFRLGAGGLAIFLGIIFVCGLVLAVVLNKSKNNIQLADFGTAMVGGVGGVIFFLIGLAFLVLLFVNIVLWIFLPLIVYSIKEKLDEVIREIKNLKDL
jgi:hypothetical protein